MAAKPEFVGPYERLVLLRAASLSSDTPVEALTALARQAGEHRFPAGSALTTGDRPWADTYVVVEGRLDMYQQGRLLYSSGPKEACGFVESLARIEGAMEMRAEIETLALHVTSTTLFAILEDHFVMTVETIAALGRMLLTTPEWLATKVNERRFPVPVVVPRAGMDLVDRLRLLKASDLFKNTRLDSLAEVAAQCADFRVDAGTVLWREGEPADFLTVLLEGRVEGTSAGGLQFSWGPGTAPGLVEGLADAPRWYDAVTVTPVTGLRFSVERFLDALEDDFGMAADVLAGLSIRCGQQRRALGAARPAPLGAKT